MGRRSTIPIPVCQSDVPEEDFGLKAKWHFHVTEHGKVHATVLV